MKMYNFKKVEISSEYTEKLLLGDLAGELVRIMTEKKLTLSSAESCTGGLIGGEITAVSGSSAVYAGGIITYTNDVKINVLGVDADTIAEHTEVSAPVAYHMAMNVKERLSSDIGVSATGFAGPTGGNQNDPVGTVYVGMCTPMGNFVHRLSFYDGAPREAVRSATVAYILKQISHILIQ